MQDALLDIFSEETEASYYDVLLHGFEDVSIEELAALCDQVAGELRAAPAAPLETQEVSR